MCTVARVYCGSAVPDGSCMFSHSHILFTGDVDDRPLTASAWKAWLGESSNKSSLEKKVETAFSRHVTSKENEIHRAEPFRISSPPAVEQQSAGRRGDHSHAEKVRTLDRGKCEV